MTPEDNVKIMYEQLDARLISAKATGLYHEDYFNASKTDWVNARRIINGKDKAELIASYAEKFYTAITLT